jgi:hypothetical protein
MKDLVIEYKVNYVDHQGKPGSVSKQITIRLNEEDGAFVTRISPEALRDVIEIAQHQGLNISVKDY